MNTYSTKRKKDYTPSEVDQYRRAIDDIGNARWALKLNKNKSKITVLGRKGLWPLKGVRPASSLQVEEGWGSASTGVKNFNTIFGILDPVRDSSAAMISEDELMLTHDTIWGIVGKSTQKPQDMTFFKFISRSDAEKPCVAMEISYKAARLAVAKTGEGEYLVVLADKVVISTPSKPGGACTKRQAIELSKAIS